jgi:hypothetical protein
VIAAVVGLFRLTSIAQLEFELRVKSRQINLRHHALHLARLKSPGLSASHSLRRT